MRRDLSKWFGSLSSARRSLAGRRMAKRSRGAQVSLAGGEPLDSRKMLAVTASVVGNVLQISLGAADDAASLTFDGTKYTVAGTGLAGQQFLSAGLTSIDVAGTSGAGQLFDVLDGNAIVTPLTVGDSIERTRIFSNIGVTSATAGVSLLSPETEINDATPANPLSISTTNKDITFSGVVTILDSTDFRVSTGAGAGDIDFLGDILGGGEAGSGTLTLAAGTGAITFGGDIGGSGVGEDLHGVNIQSAASATATGKFHLDGDSPIAFQSGLTIRDGVNNVNFSNGGTITGFSKDSANAGIFFDGSSTNSTIKNFSLRFNTYGIYAGNYYDTGTTSDLSGTLIDDNVIGEDDVGIYLDSVAGNLNGEDAFVIGGTAGNVIAGNGTDGIYGFASTGVEIRNNLIIANGIDDFGSGISLEGGGEYLISGNTIGEDGVGRFLGQGNSYDGITIDGEDGFYSYAGTEIIGNDIEYNSACGVRVQGVTQDTGEDSILIFDNKIANNGIGWPFSAGSIQIIGSENIRIIYNVISLNGENSAGNGINILSAHGTAVFSNTIALNANHGIYVVDSSTAANPVQIGDVLPIGSVTATTVTTEGDARAAILPGQQIGLAYVVDPTNVVATSYLITRTVLSVSYDDVEDVTTLTFSNVPGAPNPYAITLGNYIFGNGEDSLAGSGISVLASGEETPDSGTVEGIEILGNVIVGNQADGIHLESTRPASFGDLSGAVIAGNFVGRDPVGEDSPNDFGNGIDGISVINGDGITIQANYVAANGREGIYIQGSRNVDIGEDDLGNAIVRNSGSGVYINGGQFVRIVENEIADNDFLGIYVFSSQDVLIRGNSIH
ncbi:MAG: right-handed parallel beta-helix repeat-containing protein, partial [Planctomycetia bacterium]